MKASCPAKYPYHCSRNQFGCATRHLFRSVDQLPEQWHLKLSFILNAGCSLPPFQCNASFLLCAIKHFLIRSTDDVESSFLKRFKRHLGMIQGSSWCPCLGRRGGQEEVTSKPKQPVVLWRHSGIDLTKTQVSTASASPCQAVTWAPERGTERNWHPQILSWNHQCKISLLQEQMGIPGYDLLTWSAFTLRSGFDQIPQAIKISIDPYNVPNLKDLCWDFTWTSLWQEMLCSLQQAGENFPPAAKHVGLAHWESALINQQLPL